MSKQTVKAIVVRRGKPAVVEPIGSDLKSMQSIVGGYIERVGLGRAASVGGVQTRDALAAYVNEEGILQRLERNRMGFLGDFFIVRERGEDAVDVTPGDYVKLADKLAAMSWRADGKEAPVVEPAPKNKGGRPRVADPRERHQIRFSAEELALLMEGARLAGAEFGLWLRELGLKRARALIKRAQRVA